MLALDIVELDGEAVGGGGQFVLGEQQRGRDCPARATSGRCPRRRPSSRGVISLRTQRMLIVGEFGLVVAGRGRAVEDHGDQAFAVGLLEFLDELRE